MQIPSGNAFFDWRREQFPFFERKICLTHASVSPLPARVSGAICDFTQRLAHEGQFDYFSFPLYHSCKARIAALLNNGAKADNIAFAGSTSHALGLVATSLDWKAGENCVVCDGDFPANVTIWKNLTHTHGVEVRLAPRKAKMDITVEDLAPLLDEKTRIVSLSATNFLIGYTLDIAPIAEYLHQRGILLCIDGIQALGAIQLDLSQVDFVCADAHKWLLGPNGAAFAWFAPAAMERMRPQILGWLASENRADWFAYDTTPYHTAERFEPGARNYLGIAGLDASLSLLLEVGMETVSTRITSLRNHGAQLLQELDCPLLWVPEPTRPGGIVSFRSPDGDSKALYQKLDEKFALALRSGVDGLDWIRVSAHFMNCEDDLNELATAIKAALA